MGWLIVGLLIGYAWGKAKRPGPSQAVLDGAERLKTRSRAALILVEKARAVVNDAGRQAIAGQMSIATLAELTNTIGDLGFMTGDMIDDQVVLLKEVAHGRT